MIGGDVTDKAEQDPFCEPDHPFSPTIRAPRSPDPGDDVTHEFDLRGGGTLQNLNRLAPSDNRRRNAGLVQDPRDGHLADCQIVFLREEL